MLWNKSKQVELICPQTAQKRALLSCINLLLPDIAFYSEEHLLPTLNPIFHSQKFGIRPRSCHWVYPNHLAIVSPSVIDTRNKVGWRLNCKLSWTAKDENGRMYASMGGIKDSLHQELPGIPAWKSQVHGLKQIEFRGQNKSIGVSIEMQGKDQVLWMFKFL